jgi:hypothetical protein
MSARARHAASASLQLLVAIAVLAFTVVYAAEARAATTKRSHKPRTCRRHTRVRVRHPRCRVHRVHRRRATSHATSVPARAEPQPPSSGSGSSPSRPPQRSWVSPGAAPLSDAQAAGLVTHQPETRSGNVAANNFAPTDAQLQAFYSTTNQYGQTSVQWNPLYRYVTGRSGLSNPSTDDLIQWTAHKWGIPEDWIRAQMVVESNWHMNHLGDRTTMSSAWYSLYPSQARVAGTSDAYQSMGIAQVRWRPDGSVGPGTEPLRWQSTAFNLDFYAATIRYYYDGLCNWCGTGYSAGQQWNSIGAWYEPSPWNNASQQSYIQKVASALSQRPWAQAGFAS